MQVAVCIKCATPQVSINPLYKSYLSTLPYLFNCISIVVVVVWSALLSSCFLNKTINSITMAGSYMQFVTRVN